MRQCCFRHHQTVLNRLPIPASPDCRLASRRRFRPAPAPPKISFGPKHPPPLNIRGLVMSKKGRPSRPDLGKHESSVEARAYARSSAFAHSTSPSSTTRTRAPRPASAASTYSKPKRQSRSRCSRLSFRQWDPPRCGANLLDDLIGTIPLLWKAQWPETGAKALLVQRSCLVETVEAAPSKTCSHLEPPGEDKPAWPSLDPGIRSFMTGTPNRHRTYRRRIQRLNNE